MLGDKDKESARNIIGSSETEAYRRVFFLGPYARRVSFSSQQNRALNLVWALQGMERIKRGDHIAVVGGGLSGLTATAALLERGYLVTLYEGGEDALNRQSSADHRYIHPSVNRWPEKPIEETTVVPYFDWVSSLCSNLVESLRKQWGSLRTSKGLRFVPHAHVVDFSENDEEAGVVTHDSCDASSERYAAVLVTSGFADENYGNTSDFPGYWRPDGLEAFIASEEARKLKYLVSGCGDGGLIDALRIAHKKFEKGRLIVDIARELQAVRIKGREWPWLKLISDAEAQVAQSKAGLAEAISAGSETLQKVYQSAAKDLPRAIEAMLDSSLRTERGPKFVTLLSRQKGPYSPMSAPIHKLMIAHAIRRQVIVHKCCYVADWKKNHVMVAACGTKEEDLAAAPKLPIGGHVILRHGAQPNFRQFFPADQQEMADDLIARQRLLAADLDAPLWSTGKHSLVKWPPKGDFAGDLKDRVPMAMDLINRTIDGLKGQFLDIEDDKGFFFFYSDDETARKVASLPNKMFGFPLTKQRRVDRVFLETGAKGGDPRGVPSSVRTLLRPGHPVVCAWRGRLGPIFEDSEGQLVSITVGHIAPARGSQSLPIIGDDGVTIGHFDSRRDLEALMERDADLVALAPEFDIEPSYSGFQAISGTVGALDAFGEQVFLERRSGHLAVGYVSATSSAVWLRHPGSGKRIVVEDAVRVRSADPSSPFAEAGDSGAPVVNAAGRLLGVVMSGDSRFSYVLPIQDVITRLGLKFLTRSRPGTGDFAATPSLFAETLNLFADSNRCEQEDPITDMGEPPPELDEFELEGEKG